MKKQQLIVETCILWSYNKGMKAVTTTNEGKVIYNLILHTKTAGAEQIESTETYSIEELIELKNDYNNHNVYGADNDLLKRESASAWIEDEEGNEYNISDLTNN